MPEIGWVWINIPLNWRYRPIFDKTAEDEKAVLDSLDFKTCWRPYVSILGDSRRRSY